MVCYHSGSRSPETACVSAPPSRLGGEFPDSGSTIGDEKQRPVPRLLCHASGTPPNVAENNNNMTIRRIYNKIKLCMDVFGRLWRCAFCVAVAGWWLVL